MALFLKKDLIEIIFDKEKVMREILDDSLSTKWIAFIHPYEMGPDILCIRSVDIQKEISIKKNPFSDYRRISSAIYQIVVGVYVSENMDDIEIDRCDYWRNIRVNSSELLFRKLEMEE